MNQEQMNQLTDAKDENNPSIVGGVFSAGMGLLMCVAGLVGLYGLIKLVKWVWPSTNF
jgi:hypothetical protein